MTSRGGSSRGRGRGGSSSGESVHVESSKGESVHVESSNGGPGNAGSNRGGSSRGERGNAGSSRGDSGRGGSSRGERGNADSSRGDSGRGGSSRGERGNADSSRGDSGRGGSSRGGHGKDWNPMQEDFNDPTFNTYTEGPGQGHRPNSNREETCTLFIGNVPLDLNEDGLKNIFSTCGVSQSPAAVRIMPFRGNGLQTKQCCFVEYSLQSDAEMCIRNLHHTPPYQLSVNYKLTDEEKKQRIDRKNNRFTEEKGSVPSQGMTSYRGKHSNVAYQAEGTERIRFEICPGLTPNTSDDLSCEPGTDGCYDHYNDREYKEMDRSMMEYLHMEGGSMFGINAGRNGRVVRYGRGHHVASARRSNGAPNINQSPRPNGPGGDSVMPPVKQQPAVVAAPECVACGKISPHKCNMCKVAVYCSEQCAIQHWPTHRGTCVLSVPPPGVSLDVDLVKLVDTNGNHDSLIENLSFSVSNGNGIDNVPEACNLSVAVNTTKNLNSQFSSQTDAHRKPDRSDSKRMSSTSGQGSESRTSEVSLPRAIDSEPAKKIEGWMNTEELVSDFFTEVVVITTLADGVWVTKTSNKNAIVELINDLFKHRTSLKPCDLEVGTACAAWFESCWYRAKIVAVRPQLEVFYLDFGNTQTIGLMDIKTLPPSFCRMKAQAMKIVLEGGTPQEYGRLCDKTVLVKAIKKRPDGCTIVELQGRPMSGRQQPPRAGQSPRPGQPPHPGQSPRGEQVSSPGQPPHPGQSPRQSPRDEQPSRPGQSPRVSPRVEPEVSHPVQSPRVAETPNVETNAVPIIAPVLAKITEEMPSGTFSEVTISILDQKDYWVTMNSKSVIAAQLIADLNKQSASLARCTATLGDIVAAEYSEGGWYRAKILCQDPLQVLFIDFGNVERTKDIRRLPTEFSNLPAQAIKVRLHEKTPEKFLNLSEEEKVLMKPVGMTADGYVIVEVNKLQSASVAVPETEVQVALPVNTVVTAPETEVQVALPVNTVVTVPETEVKEDLPVNTVVVVPKIEVKEDLPINKFVELPEDTFTKVVITFSGEKEYSVQTAEGRTVVADMDKKMQAAVKSFTACTPTVDCLVAALYYGEWYRGKVTSVEPLKVLYLDYGNEEGATLDTIRTLPETFFSLPAQAIKIVLKEGTPAIYFNLNMDKTLTVMPVGKVGNATMVSVKDDAVSLLAQPVTTPVPEVKESLPIDKGVELPANIFTEVQVTFSGEKDYCVQTALGVTVVEDIYKKMQAAIKSFTACKPTVGSLVAALYDGAWYRGKVTSAEPLKVLYLDYGNEEVATLDTIRSLPSTFLTLPTQAVKITLAIDTPTQYWNLDIDKTLHVMPVGKFGDATLVSVKNDTIVSPVQQAITVPVPEVKETFPIDKMVELPANTFSEVQVTFPGDKECYVQLAESVLLSANLFINMQNAVDSYTVCKPTVGCLVAGLYDGGWYRGKVTSVEPLKVLYLDYGNEEIATPDMIRSLPNAFKSLPTQAIKITLSADTPAQYCNLGMDKKLSVMPVGKVGDSTLVSVQHEIVAPTVQQTTVEPPVVSPAVASTTGQVVPPVVAIPSRQAAEETEKRIAREKLGKGVETKVTVSSAGGMSFWVCKSEQYDDDLVKSHQAMMDVYTTLSVCKPKPGNYVAVLYEGICYRAEIVEVSDTKIECFFLDYGFTSSVAVDAVRTLPEEFRKENARAIQVTLQDGTPQKYINIDLDAVLTVKAVKKLGEAFIVEVIPDADKPSLNIPSQVLPPADFTNVFLTFRDEDDIYVQMELNLALVGTLVSNSDELKCCEPTVGDFVLVSYDECWSRAQVLSVSPKIKVRYIDYGNEEEALLKDVRELPSAAATLPAQGVKIQFAADTDEAVKSLPMYSPFCVKPIAKAADGSVIVQAKLPGN